MVAPTRKTPKPEGSSRALAARVSLGRRARLVPLILLALGPLSCGVLRTCFGETVMKPVHRFVDRGDGPATTDWPVASFLDDTRYVLAAPPEGLILWRKNVPVPAGRRLRFDLPLPKRLTRAARLLVMPSVVLNRKSTRLDPILVETDRRPRQTRVKFDLVVPPEMAETKVQIHLFGYAIDTVDLADLQFDAVEIPEGAVLEFAMGIRNAQWGGDPVEFTVTACEADDCEQIFSEVVDPGAQEPGWHDRRLPLAKWVGRTTRFRFQARRKIQRAAFSLPMWANPTIYAPVDRSDSDVNVIMLSIDTLRADHLTSYGYRRDTAPFMEEAFGKGGTVFENHVAAATLTTPSHMSMFTSLQPATHGTLDGLSKKLPWHIATLAELVRSAMIETGAFTEDGWLGAYHGFGRGFDVYGENKSAEIMAPTGQVDKTFEHAKHWLEWNRGKRFFLFLHTFQVHSPYAPPEQYADLFAEGERQAGDASTPQHLRLMADYDREIRYTDDELRRFFATLDALDLSDKTVFILTSDHGEEFMEHGLREHGAHMYEEAIRVPLLLRGPGIPARKRVGHPVAHVDLMPTVLGMFGIPAPPRIEGRSLLPLLAEGNASEPWEERALFSESRAPTGLGAELQPVPFKPPAFSVRLGSRKLARYRTEDGYRFELHDLDSDPLEKTNLFSSQSQSASDLVALIDEYEQRSAALRNAIDRAGDAAPDSDQPAIQLDPEQEEKVRALGYLR